MTPAGDLDGFLKVAADPPAEYGMMPFWFWNDDLDEAELLRQVRAFAAAGMGGVVIHPRVGLSHRVGYLTPEYFRLVRLVVDACADLGMKVILYDEGSYPSGSACGQVVAENPDFAAAALVLARRAVRGPSVGYWRPSAGRTLCQRVVSCVLARAVEAPEGQVAIDPGSVCALEPDPCGLVRLDVPAGDFWALACIEVPSGGTIRGVFAEHEDGLATAPPAADLMRAAAVAAFVRLTHDAYARALEGHLGSTVIAMFTDEPNPTGRGGRRGGQPYTAGFEALLAGYLERDPETVRAWLPALWADFGPETAVFRRAYGAGIRRRIREVFYGAQARWCTEHGLALTGHPADSDDMASLADFHWPGQDMVWRWVVPGDGSGTTGPNSVAPKAAVSAARVGGRRRAVAEIFGAYGWRLSLDEAKWLLDWHLSRGVNLILPHACFYSIRGGRAYESEPDIGLHNPWWPHFARLARYARRICWLLTDGTPACSVAIIGDGDHLPWAAARQLAEAQVDFTYLDAAAVAAGVLDGPVLQVGGLGYTTALFEEGTDLSPSTRARLEAWAAGGGRILPADRAGELDGPVRVTPAAPNLRLMHVTKDGIEAHLFFNEGEDAVCGTLTGLAPGEAVWWDPLRDGSWPAGPAPVLRLPRRECRVLLVGPGPARTGGPVPEPPATDRLLDLFDWDRPLGDWARERDLERFSGTLSYEAAVTLAEVPARAELDLGRVGDAADVSVNGRPAGFVCWAPHVLQIPGQLWRAGRNTITVAVTNSAANAHEGLMLPSGLMGPVRLRLWPAGRP